MNTRLSFIATVPSFATLTLNTVRTFLHLLGVAGWIGGQILMLGLLGVLRSLGPDAPRIAAIRFGWVAWPCFALAVTTGVWSLTEVGLSKPVRRLSRHHARQALPSRDVGSRRRRAHNDAITSPTGRQRWDRLPGRSWCPLGRSRTGYLNH